MVQAIPRFVEIETRLQSVVPYETDASLFVVPDTMSTCTPTLEYLQMIRGRNPQVVEALGPIQRVTWPPFARITCLRSDAYPNGAGAQPGGTQ